MKKIILLTAASCVLLAACSSTKVVDLDDKSEVAGMSDVMELEYRDWGRTADKMVDSMLKSGSFAKIDKPVIAMGPMINDTMQRFDTDILVKKIRSQLVNSGHAQVATSFRNDKKAEDESTHNMRNQRDNAEYAASTVASKGTLVAPNMSLSGKMLQRNLKIDNGWFSNKDNRVEYYLQLTLTDLKTGLSVWEDERPIVKEGKRAPKW